MYCYQCGAKVPDGSTFCPECGVKLARANKSSKSSSDDTKNEKIIAKVEQLKNGDATAFDELYNLTHDRIYYLALKITQNREDALEAVQETYLSVYQKIGGLANPAVFRAWISKILVNKCMDLLGKQTEYLALDSREQGEEDIFDRMEESGSDFIPHEALDKEETRNMMMSLIDRLPGLQRITLLLYYYQQLGVNEIAAVMDCPVATVKSRLQYARKQIKQGVEAYEAQGVKLYGFGSGPGLIFALKELAKYNTLPSADASHILSLVQHTIVGTAPGGGVLSPSGNPAQPPAHVGTPHTGGTHAPIPPKSGFLGKIAHASLSKKIITGVAILAIAGTAGFVAPHLLDSHQNAPAVNTETGSVENTPENQDNTVGNTPSNLLNEGLATMQNDTIYYVDCIADEDDEYSCVNVIKSMDVSGENEQTIYTNPSKSTLNCLNVIGENLYFLSGSEIDCLNLKDMSVTTLYSSTNMLDYVCVTKDKLYYMEYDDDSGNGIYVANLDGSDPSAIVKNVEVFTLTGDYIYYLFDNAIYRCDTEGNDTTEIYLSSGDFLYFCTNGSEIVVSELLGTSSDDQIFTFSTLDMSGNKVDEIYNSSGNEEIYFLNLTGNKLYFENDNEEGFKVYLMDIGEPEEKTMIGQGENYTLSVCGDWLFSFNSRRQTTLKLNLNEIEK